MSACRQCVCGGRQQRQCVVRPLSVHPTSRRYAVRQVVAQAAGRSETAPARPKACRSGRPQAASVCGRRQCTVRSLSLFIFWSLFRGCWRRHHCCLHAIPVHYHHFPLALLASSFVAASSFATLSFSLHIFITVFHAFWFHCSERTGACRYIYAAAGSENAQRAAYENANGVVPAAALRLRCGGKRREQARRGYSAGRRGG